MPSRKITFKTSFKDDNAPKSDRVAGENVEGTKRRQLGTAHLGMGGDVGVIGHPEGARCSWHGEDDDVEEDEK